MARLVVMQMFKEQKFNPFIASVSGDIDPTAVLRHF